MVFYPAVLVLQLVIIAVYVGIVGVAGSQRGIVLLVEDRPGRRQRKRGHELRTTAWEQLVISRGTRERYTQVDVVTVTIRDNKVVPVLQHVTGIGQRHGELEVVIRPAQALTPSYRHSEELDVLIVVEHGGVVVVTGVVCTVAAHVVIVVVHPSRVTIGAGDIALLREEGTDAERIRALATKPVGRITGRDGVIVGTVRLVGQ